MDLPQEGGSFTRDPETGALSRTPEPKPAEPKPAEKESSK